LCEDDLLIPRNDLPQRCVAFLDAKVKYFVREVKIDNSIYNGVKRVKAANVNFMDQDSILQNLKSSKT
jgi:hypothetical protein